MRFTRLETTETGIAFTNTLKPENIRNYLINGAGLTAGDYDNDGLPDLFFVCQDGPNKLFRQVAPCKFEDATETAGLRDTGASGCGTAFVDINGDGWLDIFICNKGAPCEVWISRRDATFTMSQLRLWPDDVAAPTMAAFADYDQDGDLDFFITSHRLYAAKDVVNYRIEALKDTRTGRVTVAPPFDAIYEYLDPEGQILVERGVEAFLLRNDGVQPGGVPKLTDVTAQAGLSTKKAMGLAAVWWDANNDGWPDLYVSNDFAAPDHLYLNQRNGSFIDALPELAPYLSWFSMGSDFADVNRDGWLDYLSTDMAGSTHYKAKTTMGAMTGSAWFLDNLEPRQIMRNCLFVNSGIGRDGQLLPFLETAFFSQLANTDWTWSALFGDLDNDAWDDLYFTTGLERNLQDSDYAERAKQLASKGRSKEEAQREILALPRMAETNWVFRNKGDLEFEKVHAAWGLDFPSVSHGAVMCDFDRDGDLDIAVNTQNEPMVLLRNDSGPETHSVLISLEAPDSLNRFALGARLRAEANDGTITRIITSSRGYASGQEPTAHLGLGTAETIDVLTVTWPDGNQSRLTNLAADRHYLIRRSANAGTPIPSASSVAALFEDGGAAVTVPFRHAEDVFDDFAKQELLPNQISRLGPPVAVADVDADQMPDLFFGGAKGQPGAVLRYDSTGHFKPALNRELEIDRAFEDTGATWFDADGDDDPDLLVASGGNHLPAGDPGYQPRLYLNDGAGKLSRAPDALPAWHESSGPIAAADFDKDGDADVFIGGRITPQKYPLAPKSTLLRNDGGKFSLQAIERPLGMTTAASSADLNGDGWQDLLVAQEWGPVCLFLNHGGRLADATNESGLACLSGWWHGLATGDVDKDGDIDFIATNFGLNTKYPHVSADHPQRLFASDFAGAGRIDIVEAHHEGEALVPVRGRSCSSHAMPFLKEKFTSYAAFARASLPEIYTPEKLNTSIQLQANTLATMLFLNDGKAGFTAAALPLLAQLAPASGVVLHDFDGDGHLDAVIPQGFYLAQRETGRLNAGLCQFLKGDGRGHFEAVWPAASGLHVRADVRGLALLDVNGDRSQDLVFAINDAAPRIVLSRPSAARQ